jgi:hypothetical protein
LAFEQTIHEKLDALRAAIDAKAGEFSNAIKAEVAAGGNQPGETVRRTLRELRKLRADLLRQVRSLQRTVGISEGEIRALERELDAQLLPAPDQTFWRAQVEDIPASQSDDLDDLAQIGLEQLLGRIDPKWLRAEAQRPHRLGSDFLASPLHLVNGVRVGMSPDRQGPQRFAQMLLATQDHLMKRDDLDFFSAAMSVPEIGLIGTRLEEIKALGPEAERKLVALPSMSKEMVSATVYELLVGTACIRKGLELRMVAENRSRKVPDYQTMSLGPIPAAIECKRRLGLTAYELGEAERVERLYLSLRPLLRERGTHGSVEVSFCVPLRSVPSGDFIEHALAAVDRQESSQAAWGSVAFQPLPYIRSIPRTRLYSPEFLQHVFEWDVMQDEWDGLLCEVESPSSIAVELFMKPLCFKWRSESEEALLRKTRGITSLWGDAVKQIPDGEIGFIYIAYPEGARATIADARTREILRAGSDLWHRWSVRAPLMFVSRLYARSVGPGMPDLIESVLVGTAKGQEVWQKKLPWRIFT